MPRPKNKMNLSPAAIEVLAAELAALSRRSFHGHARLVQRLAVTYRPCDRATDVLPEARVQFDQFRLFSLSHRWIERDGLVTRSVVLGAYKPQIDLPGSGRITFACEGALTVGRLGGRLVPDPRQNLSACRAAILMAQEVEDVDQGDLADQVDFPGFYFGFSPRRDVVREFPISAQSWAAAETHIGDFKSWPAEYFARPAGTHWKVHPTDGSTDPFADESGPVEEGTIRGRWVFKHGLATPMAQQPDAIFADFGHLRGRSVRNPAFHVLREQKVLPQEMTYRRFLEQVCPHTGLGRPALGQGNPTRAAGQFLAALATHVDLEAGRADALIGAVRDACIAAGVPIPATEENAYEFLAGLLETPIHRAEVPGVARIQKVRLAGMPDPGSMTFSTGTVQADFYDLGEHAARFEQIPAQRVDEAFRQRYGRKRSPIALI